MAGAYGKGTVVYLDVDDDDQFVISTCFLNVKPSGWKRDALTPEPCLSDTSVFQDTGVLMYSEFSAVMEYQETAADTAIRAAIVADSTVGVAVKINLGTPQYVKWKIKFTEVDWEAATFDTKWKVPIKGIPTVAPTLSVSVPTLEA